MPTEALPADLFDFEDWIGKPPMAQAAIVMRNRKQWNLVLRQNTVEDNEWAQKWIKDNESEFDPEDVLIARCLVQVTRGGNVDLEAVEVPDESPLSPDAVRRLRKGAAEVQWALVNAAMMTASFTRPEPEAPSSPKS